jgi:hypothetical protein
VFVDDSKLPAKEKASKAAKPARTVKARKAPKATKPSKAPKPAKAAKPAKAKAAKTSKPAKTTKPATAAKARKAPTAPKAKKPLKLEIRPQTVIAPELPIAAMAQEAAIAAQVSAALEAPVAAPRRKAPKTDVGTAPKADARRDHDRPLQGGRTGQLTDGSIVLWAWVAIAGGVVVGLPFSEYPAGGLVQYIVFGLAVIALPPLAYSIYGRLRLRLNNHPE